MKETFKDMSFGIIVYAPTIIDLFSKGNEGNRLNYVLSKYNLTTLLIRFVHLIT